MLLKKTYEINRNCGGGWGFDKKLMVMTFTYFIVKEFEWNINFHCQFPCK